MIYLSIMFSLMMAMTGPFRGQREPSPELHQDRSTLQAKAVVKVNGWVYPFYVWRNNITLIVFRGHPGSGSLDGLDEFHLDTGRRNPLEAFDRRWDLKGKAVRYQALSPNGKWMVWNVYPADSPIGYLPGWMTLSLDGRNRVEHDYWLPEVSRVAWMRNSRKWIGLGSDHVVGVVYDVNTHKAQRFDFSSRVSLPKIGYVSWNLLAWEPNDRLLIALWPPGYNPEGNVVHFAEIPWKKEQTALRLWTVKMPPNAFARELELSPMGDRVIWNLNFVLPPGYDPKQGQPESEKRDHSEIWISGIDGTGLKRLNDLIFEDVKQLEVDKDLSGLMAGHS